jgi:hypothetical protein
VSVSLISLSVVSSCFGRAPAPPPLPREDPKPTAAESVGVARSLDTVPGRSFSVALHVDESAGIERHAEPILASVPFPPEAAIKTGRELAVLTDSGTPVPVQARILSRWEGRPDDEARPARFVLLAFEADVPASRTRPFRIVRRSIDLRPDPAVKVLVNGLSATLDTGAVKIALGGSGPIAAITDARGQVLATGASALLRGDSGDESRAAPPESIEVLEAGPVRGVVRLLGHYATRSGERGLDYALTVEGWSGRSDLRLRLETRNTGRRGRRTVKLSELALEVALGRPVEAITAPEGRQAISSGDALVLEQRPAAKGTAASFNLGLEGGARLAEGREHEGWLVAESGASSCGVALRRLVPRAPSGVRASRDVIALRFVGPERAGETAPVFQRWLGDLQHRTDEALLFFGADDAAAAARAYRSPLFGQANASWVRDTGGFLGPLPDDGDEAAALVACRLERDARTARGRVGPRPDAFVGEVSIKWDTETDEARDQLVRWVRTGERGAWDDALAWVEFGRDRYVSRLDGLSFEDAEARPRSLDAGDALEASKRLDGSRLKESHVYGEGLLGHYLLTGDRASLEAARDVAALATARFGKIAPEDPIIEMRVFARPMELIVGLVEVTGEPAYRELLERMIACAFSSRVRDRGRGCYALKLWVGEFDLDSLLPKDLSLPERFPADSARGLFRRGPRWLCVKGERGAFPYQDRELAHALARAFEVTHDERARQALLGMATFYLDEGIVPVFFHKELELTPYYVVPYVPEPEVARYPQPSSPIYSTNLGLIEAAAYLVSGDARFLEQAKRCLRIACLRAHGDLRPVGNDERRIAVAPANQWAQGWDDLRTFYALGARGERRRPEPVKDLVARPGARSGTVELGLTPGDGRAAHWIVLGSRAAIAEKGDGEKTVASFGATPLGAFTAAAKPATLVVAVPGGERSFVVLAEDAQGALSPPSNVATLP